MTLRALIFDVDGTLAETEEAHRLAFNDTFAAHGLDWVWDRESYAELLAVAGGRERIRHFLATRRPTLAMTDAAVTDLHRAKTAAYLARIAGGQVVLRPGVHRLLAEARRAGLTLAIATTTSRANVIGLLTAISGPDAVEAFAAIGAGEDVAAKKPDPAVYRHVLAQLGRPAADCLAIEDSAIGLQASRAAGIPTVVAPSTYTAGEDFAGAVGMAADLGGVGLADLRHWHEAAVAPPVA